MGLRLTLLGWWTPKFIIRKELDHVSKLTTNALKSLLAADDSKAYPKICPDSLKDPKSIEEKRDAMSKEHTAIIQALVGAFGQDKAVKLGREILFNVGMSLGEETRAKLGVGDSPKDLIRAAKVLYRVLGIDFNIKWLGENEATLVVDNCALARGYSELTCQILSATDEGVIKGLEPNVNMMFRERMTSGCPKCKADIKFNKMGN
jgi:hypothetical protein